MSTDLDREIWIEVCPLEELEREGVKVVSGEGRPVAIFFDQGRVYALDNRCPHMGFPLHRGTVARPPMVKSSKQASSLTESSGSPV